MNKSTEILVLITFSCLLGTVWTAEEKTRGQINLAVQTPSVGPSQIEDKTQFNTEGLIVDDIQNYYTKGHCIESAQKNHVKWHQFKSCFKWTKGKDHEIVFYGLMLPEPEPTRKSKNNPEMKPTDSHAANHASSVSVHSNSGHLIHASSASALLQSDHHNHASSTPDTPGFEQEEGRHSTGHKNLAPDYSHSEIRDEALAHAISLNSKDNLWTNRHHLKKIKPTDKILLVLHGWTDSIEGPYKIHGLEWMLAVGREWRHYGKGHVFLIDWRVHAFTLYPVTAKKKIKQVAEVILKFLRVIYAHLHAKDKKLTFQQFLDNVEGAGHSLGAHLFAILGHILRLGHPSHLLSVIYGLDPAGGFFRTDIFGVSNDENKFYRLNKRCAKKVLTLHTQMGILGIRYASGHYSFYSFVELEYEDWCNSETRPPGCKHQRAINLFIASMKEESHIDNQLIGFKCNEHNGLVDTTMTSRFGIHHKNTDPVEEGEGVYFMPIGRCSPYNEIKNKINTKLPVSCVVERKIKKFWKVFGKGSVQDVTFEFEDGEIATGVETNGADDDEFPVIPSSAGVAGVPGHHIIID